MTRIYLSVRSLLGSIEKIDGSSDRYLVINKSNIEVINVFNTLREYIEDKVILDKIDGFDKIRFNSDIDLPLGTLIQFKILTIIIRCIIKKFFKKFSSSLESMIKFSLIYKNENNFARYYK